MAQQNLDFNIVAHTKGMEAIATLINRVGSLEAETKRLASANQQLSASTDTVIRNGVRYNNAMDAQSRQLRQNRQGTQQLGMQMNDFATSVSSGSSVQQAFAQQLGQVGYAMSQMEGVAGKVGGFLAGPWGGMIVIASLALGALIEKLGGATKETDNLFDASKGYTVQATQQELANSSLVEITDALNRISGRYTETLDQEAKASAAVARTKLKEAETRLKNAEAAITEAEATAENLKVASQAMRIGIGEPGARSAAGAASALAGGFELATKGMKSELEKQKQIVKNARDSLNYLISNGPKRNGRIGSGGREDSSSVRSGGSSGKKVESFANVNFLERDAAFLKAALDKGTKYWADYYDNFELTSVAVLKQIAEDGEMVTAKIQTVGDTAGPIFLDRFMEVQTAFQSIGNSVASAFQGMLTGAMSWKDGMKGIIQSVINELWRLYVVQQIVGFVTKTLTGAFYGGGGGASVGNAFAKVTSSSMAPGKLGPAFANGTVNAQGGMALVGERGPEIVNLPRGSQVIPAHRAQNMMGGGINISVDARGSADPAAVRAQVQAGILQAAPAIIAAAEARTVQGLRRPRLGGAMK